MSSVTGIELGKMPINRVVACSHPDYPNYRKDFCEFWIGPTLKKTSRRTRPWSGGFRGRPVLAEALWPVVQDELQGRKPRQFHNMSSALRSFWRFLDAYEQQGFAPIVEVADITSGLAVLWLNPIDGAWSSSNSQVLFNIIRKLVRKTRERFSLSRAWVWGSFPKSESTATKDLPSEAMVRAAMSLLKQTAYAIYHRWKRADALASVGRNLFDMPRTVPGKRSSAFDFETTEADAHATYRAFIAKSGNPLPLKHELLKLLGFKGHACPNWWPKHDEDHSSPGEQVRYKTLVEGLYPTIEDLDCLALLCMARSGWNPATVYALDVSTPDWARPHGDAGSPLWLIEAFKERSRTWQWTLSPERLSTGFHYIVSSLIQRTKPLRALIESDATRCGTPAVAVRSPWICTGSAAFSTSVLVRTDTSGGAAGAYWKRLVREHNDRAAPDKLVYEFITPSDWRDIFASHLFQYSRYSWVLVQWALGHKHMASTRHYLRRLLWRRYSEKKLYDLQILLVDGIEAHARVDVTIIRARIDLGADPSAADIARLESHRLLVRERELSYSGYGCMDRNNPPAEIDPSNPRDGSFPCSRSDRCPSCPIAQAIDVRHMAKRLAELLWLSRQVNATVWLESHYAADLEVLQADLKQWPAEEVAAHVAYWEREIKSGRHKVIRFGGKQ